MREATVLYVEDSDAFAYLLESARKECGLPTKSYRVPDGEQALNFLRREPPFEAASPPDLIFLDLNLPKKNGFELLAEIRSDEQFRTIPVIVLSAALDSQVRERALELGATEYIPKPFDFAALLRTVSSALARYGRYPEGLKSQAAKAL